MLVLEVWEEIQDPVGQQWQKQANHFQAVITDMQAIVADTTSRRGRADDCGDGE